MKLIRYRKPSLKTALGITATKRHIKRSLGISQVEAWTKPSRVKQRIKYKMGWYTPQMKVLRNTIKGKYPSFLGLFNSKKK